MPINTALNRKAAMLVRWLHIYLSMISFAIVFFFAVTGLTLNHADRFAGQVHTTQEKGHMNPAWTSSPDTLHIDKLAIVEYLRRTHGIKAALSDFRIDDTQLGISFKGPGYAADAFVDRVSGDYDLTKTSAGFVGLINDLHKGRDTGPGWNRFIDICAIMLALVSLTGMLLLLFLKRRRLSGLLIAALGLLLAWLIYKIWIK
ncbi:MAG TPA: PepSY-associated TM helix domain-containing protein [Puia sp.]|nr:PepSY-associated TM helix domain-containing protein [Puia sp.]